MTLTKQLLRLLADGKHRSIDQLATESGLPRKTVQQAVNNMSTREYLASNPITYGITETGKKRALIASKLVEDAREKAAVRMANMRHRRLTEELVKKEQLVELAKVTVERAKRTRPALDMAWGATLGAREGAQA